MKRRVAGQRSEGVAAAPPSSVMLDLVGECEQPRRYLCAARMAEAHRNAGKDDLPFPVCKDRELGPALE